MITGRFDADFANFTTAVAQAETKLREFEQGSARVEGQINRMVDSFSGRKVVSEATLMVSAVERVGGAAKLTEAEQARVNRTTADAILKFQAFGEKAPAAMVALEQATRKIPEPVEQVNTRMVALGTAIGQFVGNAAWSAVSRLTDGVMNFAAQGAQLPAVETSFNRLAVAMGESADVMLGRMQAGTRGLVTDFDLMLAGNKAMLLGLPVTSASMGELAQTASVLGRAVGITTTQAFDDLITALGRSSPMILDNLGLTVKVGEANDAYAAKLGKSASQLTEAEKKIAFYEAAMEKARAKTAELGEQTMTLGDIATSIWTGIGNTVTRTAASLNVGVGAILTNGGKAAQFMLDAIKLGPGFALTLASMREEAVALGQVKPPPSVVPESIDPLVEYRKELGALRSGAAALTEEQKAVVREALALNQSATQIAAKIQVSETAVSLYVDALKASAKAEKDLADEQERAAQKYAAAMTEIDSAGESWRGTLRGIHETLVAHVKTLLDAGVSQSAIATAYGLTATQVKAVVAALKEENEAIKLTAKSVEETAELWREFETNRIAQGGTDLQVRKALIEEWFANEAAKLDQNNANWKNHYDALAAVAAQRLSAVMVDWNALGDNSRQHLVDIAERAEATYNAALASSGNFTSGYLDQLQQTVIATREAATAWGDAFEGGLLVIGGAADDAVGKVEQVTESVRRLTVQVANVGAGTDWAQIYRDAGFFVSESRIGIRGNAPLFGWQGEIGARAEGGPVSAGAPYVVGERGPEVFVPASSGTIIPNGAGSTVINISVNGTGEDIARRVMAEITRTMRTSRKWPSN